MKNNLELAFITGGSLASSFFSFAYISKALSKATTKPEANHHLIPWGVLLMYGVFNVLNVFLQKKYNNINPRIIAGLSGALGGLVLSLGGRFILDFPIKALGFNKNNQHMVHVYAPIVYSIIFSTIVQSLNYRFRL